MLIKRSDPETNFAAERRDQAREFLRSLDLFVLGFSATVVGWSFSVICFFDFVTWLGHDSILSYFALNWLF